MAETATTTQPLAGPRGKRNFLKRILDKLKKKPPQRKMDRRHQSENQSDNLKRNYKNLLYLEDARDDFLTNARQEFPADFKEQKISERCCHDLEAQSDVMFQQIENVFKRLGDLADCDLHLLQTCVEIVDEQERRDAAESVPVDSNPDPDQVNSPGQHGQPKEWRRRCLDIVETEVVKRVGEITAALIRPSTGGDADGTWLLRQQIIARDIALRDLKHAKYLSPTFTPEWDMFGTYCKTYYEHVMSEMEKRFSFELNHKDTVEVLSWMISCRDNVFSCTDGNCKSCQIILRLQEKYLREKQQQVHDWMVNALQKDVGNWARSIEPDCDVQDSLYTEFPIDVLMLLEENVKQAKDMSAALHRIISKLCLEELGKVMESYTASAKSYISQEADPTPSAPRGRQSHMVKHRPKIPRPEFFVQYAIALLNNFDKITSRLQQIKPMYDSFSEVTEVDSKNNNNKEMESDTIDGLIQKVKTQTKECAEMLLPKLHEDMSGDFAKLVTRAWVLGNEKEAVDSMCDKMTSYLRQLREPFRSSLVPAVENMLVSEYILGLTEKRLKGDNRHLIRLDVYNKVCRESQHLEKFMHEMNPTCSKPESSPWDIVREMAEVLPSTDVDTLITTVTVIDSKYPAITGKEVRRLLKLRGDLKPAQISHIVSSSTGKSESIIRRVADATILSKLHHPVHMGQPLAGATNVTIP